MQQIILGDINIDVVQKDIKNLHLSVHPPSGRVSISAPLRMDNGYNQGVCRIKTRMDKETTDKTM